jgi:hypothetical protein
MSRDFCVDCGPGAKPRKVTRPGPRCATHHRGRRRRTSESRWAAHLLKTYRMAVEQYWKMYEQQGGVCCICQRATGRAKHLSVDHDHACCDKPPTCGGCTRGLLCTVCNKLLGHLRDDPAAFSRAVNYLRINHAKRIARIGR